MAQSGRTNLKKIGLLGGSFNPAHEGHVYISQKALEILDLDEVWWLVSPQNPLKSKEGMAPFEERVSQAKALARGYQRIFVSDIEQSLGTVYTVDTIKALQREEPRVAFVWLMGADNLVHIHHWHEWEELFNLVPVAVFDRDNFAAECEESDAVQHLLPYRKSKDLSQLALREPPIWCFLPIEKHPASSTAIRKKTKK